MAKRSRTTASSSRPATTTSRTTRAQSREVSEAPSSAQKRKLHVDLGDGATRRSRRQRTLEPEEPAHHQQLAAVEEAPESAVSQGLESVGENIYARSSILPARNSSVNDPDLLDGFENTTDNDIIDEEAKEIDPSAVPQALELLDGATNRLLALLLPDNVHVQRRTWKALTVPDSSEAKQLRRDYKLFELQREELASHDYIRPEAVRKAVGGNQHLALELDNDQSWRPDVIIMKANLVKMIHDLLILTRRSPGEWPPLEQLEAIEPIFGDVVGATNDVRIAIAANFSIIMQCVVASTSTIPHEPVHAAFATYLQVIDGSLSLASFMQRFDLSALSDQDERGIIQHIVGQLEYCGALTLEELTNRLPEDWSWMAFEEELLEYAKLRQAELSQHIEDIGGSQAIIQRVDSVITAVSESHKRNSLHTKLARGSEWGHKPPTKSATDVLRRRGKALATRQRTDLVEAQQQQASPAREPPVDTKRKQPSQHRLVQRSPQATRRQIFQEEDEPAQNAIDPGMLQDTTAGRIQSQQEQQRQPDDQDGAEFVDIEPTQDDGFQTDQRAAAMAAERRRALRDLQQAQRHQNSRPFLEEPSTASNAANLQSRGLHNAPSIPPSSIDPSVPAIRADNSPSQPQSSMLAQVKAGQAEVFRNHNLNRTSRKREMWSEEEVIRLEQLIESDLESPLSYSDLLSKDLSRPDSQFRKYQRRAEDLRFKARNLKTKVLRAGGTIKPRWDQVVLAKAQREELRRYGVEYNQGSNRGEEQEENEAEGASGS